METRFHKIDQTRSSLFHNEARVWPEESNRGNAIRMKIINWLLATSCNFVISKHAAKHQHDQLVNTTLELETLLDFPETETKAVRETATFIPVTDKTE